MILTETMELELPASHVPSVNLSTKAHRDKHRSQRRVMYPIMMMSFTMTPDVISNSNYVMIDQSVYSSTSDATFTNRNSNNNNYHPSATSPTSSSSCVAGYNGQSHQLKKINDLWNQRYPDLPDCKYQVTNKLPSMSSDSIVKSSPSPSSSPSMSPSSPSSTLAASKCKDQLKGEKSYKSILIKSTSSSSTNAEKSLVNKSNKSSHVYFVLDLITFHTYEDDDDSRSSRRGNWKTDADRFKHRIDTLEIILKPILQPQHRSNVWLKLHQQSDQSEVN